MLALVIVAVGFMLANNEPTHTGKAQTEAAQGAENHPSSEGFWAKLTDDPTAFFTMVLAGLTFVLAGTASAQIFFLISADRTTRLAARAASRSANVAARTVRSIEETAVKQLRAYVGIERAYLSGTDPSTPIMLTVVIKNGGQTPAYDEIPRLGVGAFDIRFPVALRAGVNPGEASATIMPGGTTEIRVRGIERQAALIAPEVRAFIFSGQITYRDVFNNQQFTNVRMIAHPGQMLFVYDVIGNDTS